MSEFAKVESYLPESIKEIVEIIGFPATEKLVNQLGGSDFLFAQQGKYADKLIEVLGQEDAQKLLNYFSKYGAREMFYIPRCDSAIRILRNQRFVREFHDFCQENAVSRRMAMVEICPKYGISTRYGWELVRNETPCYTQPSLL